MLEQIEEARALLTQYCSRIDTGGWFVFPNGKQAAIQRFTAVNGVQGEQWAIAIRPHAGTFSTHNPLGAIHEALEFLLHYDVWHSGDNRFTISRGYCAERRARTASVAWGIDADGGTTVTVCDTSPQLVKLCDELISGEDVAGVLRDWLKRHVDGVW